MNKYTKFYVFGAGPIILVLWLLVGLTIDFVFSTVALVISIIGTILIVKYLEWISDLLDD